MKIDPLNISFVIIDMQSISISANIEYLFHCCFSKNCSYLRIQSRIVGCLLISHFLPFSDMLIAVVTGAGFV